MGASRELAAMVAEILSGMEHEPPVKGGDYQPTAPQRRSATPPGRRRLCPGCDNAGCGKLYLVKNAENEENSGKMKERPRRVWAAAGWGAV